MNTNAEKALAVLNETCEPICACLNHWSYMVKDLVHTKHVHFIASQRALIAKCAGKLDTLCSVVEQFPCECGGLRDIRDKVAALEALNETSGKEAIKLASSNAIELGHKLSELLDTAKTCNPATPSQMSPTNYYLEGNENEETFAFLHLTDLHLGASDSRIEWNKVAASLISDLKRIEDRYRINWNAIFFTGDIAFSDAKEQYENFDTVLSDLYSRWTSSGSSPEFLAIPGNHDLTQIEYNDSDAQFSHLTKFHQQPAIGKQVLDAKNPLHEYVTKPFDEYKNWWETLSYKPEDITGGKMPGDFSHIFKLGTKRVGVVGLNSTFMNIWSSKSYSLFPPKGNQAVLSQQLDSVCGGNVSQWCAANDINILLTHHPANWMNAKSKFDEILNPNNFNLHFCGHQHEPQSTVASKNSATPTRSCLGRSLFGREWKSATCDFERIHGFSYYILKIGENETRVRHWPRQTNKNFHHQLIPDYWHFKLCQESDDHGTAEEIIKKHQQ